MIRLVFENGELVPQESAVNLLPKGVTFHHSKNRLLIHVDKGNVLNTPLYLIHRKKGDHVFDAEHDITVAEQASLILMEEYEGIGTYHTNVNTVVQMGPQAKLHYYKIQNEAEKAVHTASMMLQQAEASMIDTFILSLGAFKSNHIIKADLKEKNARCKLNGLYWLDRDLRQDEHWIDINHLGSHTQSSMQYKGILNQKSRALFRGKVFVSKGTKQIDAKQANHHLLLSNAAEAVSKPELEIYAEDVKCSHGSTLGQLDEDALFYLRSRGFRKEEAITCLITAFAADILNAVSHSEVLSRWMTVFHQVIDKEQVLSW